MLIYLPAAIRPYKAKTDISGYTHVCAEARPSNNQLDYGCCLAWGLQYKQCFHSTKVIRNVLSINHLKKDCPKIRGIDSRIGPLESVLTTGEIIFGPELRQYAQIKKYLYLS